MVTSSKGAYTTGCVTQSSAPRSPAPAAGHCSPASSQDTQTEEQLYQINSRTVKEVLGPTTDFPTWGSGNGTENPQENLTLEASGIGLQNLHRTGETDSWRAETKPCVHQDPEERSSGPHKRLTQTCLRVSRSLRWRYGLEAACCRVGGSECGSHYIHYLHHSLVSGQTTGRIHSPAHQQKIGLKIYRAWPFPSNKTQFSPQSGSPIRKLL